MPPTKLRSPSPGAGASRSSREIESVLTLADVPPLAIDPPPGIEITDLGARADLAAACHAVDAEGVPDIPVEAELVPASFERWYATTLEGPNALPHACTVALAGDEVVGYAALLAREGQPGTAEHQLTAVRRLWRRRGIAAALKRAQIRWALDSGLDRLVTFNDEVNLPMRDLNARLGYVPQPPILLMRGPLASSPADPGG
jgi:mycothiol synthase